MKEDLRRKKKNREWRENQKNNKNKKELDKKCIIMNFLNKMKNKQIVSLLEILIICNFM